MPRKQDDMTPTQQARHDLVERMKQEARNRVEDSPLISALGKELVQSSADMTRDQIRWIVRRYNQLQDERIAAHAQEREGDESKQPHAVATWMAEQFSTMEKQVYRLMRPYAEAHPAGRWMLEQKGIGPVIAASFLAYLDIEKAPTAGHFWSFAGLVPGQRQVKGELRTYNAELKTLCWNASNCFVYQANREDAYYGACYKWRKDYEWKRNLSGAHQSEVERALSERNWSEDTIAYQWLSGRFGDANFSDKYITGKVVEGKSIPMLPPAHIAARAKRYAIKLFLAHLHHVWYEAHYNTAPPLPYVIQHMGHTDFYPPKAWQKHMPYPIATPPWEKK